MKIAICFPAHGDTRAAFTASLARLVSTTHAEWDTLGIGGQPELHIFHGTSSILTRVREDLLSTALKAGDEWALLLDADQTFSPRALLRMLSHQKTVVAANYTIRGETMFPCAGNLRNGRIKRVWTTDDKIAADKLETVDFAGLGVFLVKLDAVRELERPWFRMDPAEDAYFCEKLRKAGHPIHIDHTLSATVGHIRLQELTYKDALSSVGRD